MSVAEAKMKDGDAFSREESPAAALPQDVLSSYDGSNPVFRILRASTWGPALLNLGYFPLRGPLVFFNIIGNLEAAQRRLVRKTVDLLQVRPGHQVLDVACGRGKSSFIMHCLHREAHIIGMDLLEQNIQMARTLFSFAPNLRYTVGNAMHVDFPDASFDRVMCLEAAFHFPDRRQFLQEAFRILRPGGRLVVVDFTWNTDADRARRNDPETRLVREVWQYEDMYSVDEYQRVAGECGFRLASRVDWTSRVTGPFQTLFRLVSSIGNSSARRAFLYFNPTYGSLSDDDWRYLSRAVDAHRYVRKLSKYMAFVFQKP